MNIRKFLKLTTMMNQTSSRILLYSGIFCVGLLILLASPKVTTHGTAEIASVNQALKPINYFDTVTLKAKAAYVYDIAAQKALFAKNENESLPLASLTKIMTAITAADAAPDTTLVTINAKDLKQEGDSGLYGNERWTLGKLLQYTLVVSSNDGAAAVASSIGSLVRASPSENNTQAFIGAMNSKAQNLGLTSMRFYNPSGLDVDKTQAGAYGSAHDVAELLALALKRYHTIIEPTRYASFETTSIDNIIHKAQNTDVLASRIPGLIAGKTGYSDLAGGNLAIIFDAGIQHPVAVVVLGSTYDGRFQDIDALIRASIATIVSEN